MKNFTYFLILILALSTINAFQLQGTWSLNKIQQYPIIYESVTVQISDTIYQKASILQKITFMGCQSYKYLLQSNQNNIFIKYSSFQYQLPTQANTAYVVKCNNNTAQMHSYIRNKLVEVFYFKLIGNYLVFLNPNKQIVLKFQRVQSTKIRNLRGIWNLYNLKSTQVSQKVQIADTQITLCHGKLIVGYSLNDKYGFKTRLVSNEGCEVKDLQKIVLSSAFSRKIGTSLEIYNSALEVIMLLEYVQDIDLSAAQLARQKAIEEAKANQQKANQAKIKADAKAKADSEAQIKAQAQALTTSLTLKNTKDDLLGLWQPVTIFGMPMDGSSIYFIISSNIISYNGGCNNYQFQYSVNEALKLIQIGQNKTTSNTCAVDDDGLYMNGISKISKYAVSIVGRQFRLKFMNSSGSTIYELRKTVKVDTNTNSVSSSPSISNPTNNQVNTVNINKNQVSPNSLPGLQQGRYIFLVLARRDLPRRFCTVSESKITYSGCNSIEHTFTITGQNTIKISGGGATTNNNCSVNNDLILSNAFNSITQFTQGVQTGSYILRNAKNQAVINLSLF